MTVLHVATLGRPTEQPALSALTSADRYAPDRTCIEDCITILNRYNPGPRCLVHQRQHEHDRRAGRAR